MTDRPALQTLRSAAAATRRKVKAWAASLRTHIVTRHPVWLAVRAPGNAGNHRFRDHIRANRALS